MYLSNIVLWSYIYLLRHGDAILINGSFGLIDGKLRNSTSLSCRIIPCRTKINAMVRCHEDVRCVGASFHMDGDNTAQCGTCVCVNGVTRINAMPGTKLYMKYFQRKRIPGRT